MKFTCLRPELTYRWRISLMRCISSRILSAWRRFAPRRCSAAAIYTTITRCAQKRGLAFLMGLLLIFAPNLNSRSRSGGHWRYFEGWFRSPQTLSYPTIPLTTSNSTGTYTQTDRHTDTKKPFLEGERFALAQKPSRNEGLRHAHPVP